MHSSPAAAYTASRHRGKRHGHAQRLRRHRADDKIRNMLRVSPSLWHGYLGLRVDPGPMFQQKIREAIETLEDIDDLLLCFEGWDGNLDSR